jgi:hypothetical protein
MPPLKIDLDSVERLRSHHSLLSSRLSNAADQLSYAVNGVDPAIKSRRELQLRLSYATQRLRALEERMYRISDFMRNAAEQYESTDGQIKSKIGDITRRHRRSWLENLFDGVGDAYTALTEWLASEDGKRFTEQAKANAAAQASSSPVPEEPIDYTKFIGNIEWEYGDDGSIMNIGPEDKLYYIDENGDRKLVDYFKLQELLKEFNSQTGNSYQSGPIINPVLSGDHTDFYLYAVSNGYDPRTFQPINLSDKEKFMNYIIGRKMSDEMNRRAARAWESAFFDMLPYIGQVKSLAELVMGEDLLTGEDYTGWDYGLGITGSVFSAIKGGDKLFDILKGTKHIDESALAGEVIDDISKATEGAGNAFDVAKNGGKHSGFYNQYVGKSKEEIQKGIQSLEKQIAEHQDKIRNPEATIPNFKSLDPRQQEALINKKWPSDIQRQTEQKEILEGILRSN